MQERRPTHTDTDGRGHKPVDAGTSTSTGHRVVDDDAVVRQDTAA